MTAHFEHFHRKISFVTSLIQTRLKIILMTFFSRRPQIIAIFPTFSELLTTNFLISPCIFPFLLPMTFFLVVDSK